MATTTKPDLTKLSPREIDELWLAADAALKPLVDALQETRRSISRYRKFGTPVPGYLTEREERQKAEYKAACKAMYPFEDEWERRGGWPRYYRCLSDGGHIHDHHCHTLTPGKTLIALVPELTDLQPDAVVAAVGYHACTYCFPTAPAHPAWVKGQQEAEAAEKAKTAARCPGSGSGYYRPGMRYTHCPECGAYVSVTPTGALRAHKPPQEKKS